MRTHTRMREHAHTRTHAYTHTHARGALRSWIYEECAIGAVAEWVRALAWAGDRTVSRPGSNPATVTSLRNFGNSVYPALPVSFGGDTKSRRSLLSGVYARGSKRSHQSALECVTVVDSTTHSKLPDPQSAIMRRKNAALHLYRKKKKKKKAVVAPTRKHYSPPKDPPKCMLYLLPGVPYMTSNLHISY